jgi:hypothetical protein
MQFLVNAITSKGMGMGKDKIEAIIEWQVHRLLGNVKSFLGFRNVYR